MKLIRIHPDAIISTEALPSCGKEKYYIIKHSLYEIYRSDDDMAKVAILASDMQERGYDNAKPLVLLELNAQQHVYGIINGRHRLVAARRMDEPAEVSAIVLSLEEWRELPTGALFDELETRCLAHLLRLQDGQNVSVHDLDLNTLPVTNWWRFEYVL